MYANVIVDISLKQLDRVFEYRIPDELCERLTTGSQVIVPFGKSGRRVSGYIIDIHNKQHFKGGECKDISAPKEGAATIEAQLIGLAAWMRAEYGATMNQALKTVMPVKKVRKPLIKRWLVPKVSDETLESFIAECEKKHYVAKLRLANALKGGQVLPYTETVQRLNISPPTIRSLQNKGILNIEEESEYRNPLHSMPEFAPAGTKLVLNEEQKNVTDSILNRAESDDKRPSLIYGITGSGKTETYMELIDHVLSEGKQAIVLIPEISLTFQTVMRFYNRFGACVSIIHSRLSDSERYDQFERAKNGEIRIMIGPRSALFTPFPKLGIIIIDEEHEGSYHSEKSPRYYAQDVAEKRAQMSGCLLVMGSATPSVRSYRRAEEGCYKLYRIISRASRGSLLPKVHIIDLRQELLDGNKSIFSTFLREKMADRLEKNEQSMLFLNRRGYAGFISCRACGQAVKCPHCDVTLKVHGPKNNQNLRCHYCGYQAPVPKTCGACGSYYIAPFGIGTEQVEILLKKEFPNARVLRMDADTTAKKGDHEKIVAAFANEECDILIGTQMIVKGHDFPRVTLVAALAADLSLNGGDYMSAERTFQLLTQAAGRAGRRSIPGCMVIQTYQPDHYAVKTAASQNYEAFYEEEYLYRRLLKYPPAISLLTVMISDKNEVLAENLGQTLRKLSEGFIVIGPAPAPIGKINDFYYKNLYVKSEDREALKALKQKWESVIESTIEFTRVSVQFDLY